MRNETNSLTLGRAGFLGSGSAGLVVAVLNAASAACRESIGLRIPSPAIRAPLYQGTPIRKRSEAKRATLLDHSIEPDVRIARIRLSDKSSRLHPRHVVPKRGQAYEPEVPVKVREWIGPAPASPGFVLDAQPPAQPHSGVVVDRPVRFGDGAYFKVVRPSAQRAVQLVHQLCGLLPSPRSGR